VHLLQAGEVLLAVFVAVIILEASKTHPLAPVGLIAEASVAHQAGVLVHLLQADQVLSAVFVMVVPSEASMVAAVSGALTEEAMEEVTGKLKE